MQNAKVAVARIAERQQGRIARAQLAGLGVASAVLTRWSRAGYLHPALPGVFAVGHAAVSQEADLAATLLYAGPGAMLSHATAAWWWQLTDRRPSTISVTTPRRVKSLPGIKVYGRRSHERIWHNGFPVTTIAQTLLDFAATESLSRVRYALAQADYRGFLDPTAVRAGLIKGRRGSTTLRKALDQHEPQLAYTRSELERRFFELCESAGLPLPEVNRKVEGSTVDMWWPEHRLVVELDGFEGHRTSAQINRDRNRDLRLRQAGIATLRYTGWQVFRQPSTVRADVKAALLLAA